MNFVLVNFGIGVGGIIGGFFVDVMDLLIFMMIFFIDVVMSLILFVLFFGLFCYVCM